MFDIAIVANGVFDDKELFNEIVFNELKDHDEGEVTIHFMNGGRLQTIIMDWAFKHGVIINKHITMDNKVFNSMDKTIAFEVKSNMPVDKWLGHELVSMPKFQIIKVED